MAKTIRGLTIEIGATTTKLGTELNKIKSQASGISGELKTVDKLLKFEAADKTELLKRRLEAVEKAASEVKKEIDLYTKGLDANKKAADAYEISQEQYEKNVESLNKQLSTAKNRYEVLQAELGDTARKLDEASKGIDENADSLENMGEAAKDAGKKSISLGDLIKANLISAAIINGLKGLVTLIGNVAKAAFNGMKKIVSSGIDLVVSTGEWADALLENAEVTRLSTTELQKYEYALKFIDGDIDTLTKTMTKNIRSMGDARQGNKELAASYDRLGIKVTDSTGQLRDSNVVYWEVIDALGRIPNETERDELAMTLLGKSAQELNPIINAGAEAFKALGDEAERIGYVMKPEDVEKFGAFNDKVDRLKSGLEGIKRQIAIAVMPFLDPIVKNVDDLLKDGKIQALADQYLPVIAQKMGEWGKAVADFFTSGDAKAFVEEWAPKFKEFISSLVEDLPGVVKDIGELATNINGFFSAMKYGSEDSDAREAFNKIRDQISEFGESFDLTLGETKAVIAQYAIDNKVELEKIYSDWGTYQPLITGYINNVKEEAILSTDAMQEKMQKFADDNKITLEDLTTQFYLWKDTSRENQDQANTDLAAYAAANGLKMEEVKGFFTDMSSTVDTEMQNASAAAQEGIKKIGLLDTSFLGFSKAEVRSWASDITTWIEGAFGWINKAAEYSASDTNAFGSSPTGTGWGIGNNLKGKASGGPVTANSLYRVGENGPEIFVPRVNGTILNASQTQAIMSESTPTQPQRTASVPTLSEQILEITVPQIVYLDGEVIYKNQQKIQQRKGASLIAGGTAR
ncbi:MAG: hypothetical protein AB9907_14685 [Flexilinea sp.]